MPEQGLYWSFIMAKSIPVRGTKFFVQNGYDTGVAITAVNQAAPGMVTTAATAAKGDVIQITGLPGYDGEYVVSATGTGTLTLAGADWSGLNVPGSYTSAKAAVAKWNSKFCDIKSFSRTGGTIDQEDITDICSTGKEFAAGLFDGGTLALTFNYYPDDTVQTALSVLEESGAKFWTRWEFPKVTTKLLHFGSIQTGANVDGDVTGSYQSGVTIKISGRPVRVAA